MKSIASVCRANPQGLFPLIRAYTYTDSIIFGTGAGGSSRVTLSILWNQTLETQYIKNIKITKNIERRLFTITTRITFSES